MCSFQKGCPRTALMLAAQMNNRELCMILLSYRRSDRNIRDNNGHTALDVARNNDAMEVIALLQSKGFSTFFLCSLGILLCATMTKMISTKLLKASVPSSEWNFADHVQYYV